MHWNETLVPTLREVSKDAEAVSHQLSLKAGLIRRLSSGIYSYLPLGFRVLQNISQIVREEIDRAGALELLLPALHPAELWKETGRYETLGEDKIAFKNRSGQEFVLGPTHEEVITELAAAYLKTYQSLPKILYQIQTKFRDELRPRFGIIRTKEFMMKDAYSFDVDEAGLEESYQKMYQAYLNIFKRLGLAIDVVPADPGIMGGNMSHEFMVRSPYGEDRIALCKGCGYLASRDIAMRALPKGGSNPSSQKMEAFDTPNLKTIDELKDHFKIKPERMVKTILYFADGKPVAACVRGDREVHEGKLRKLLSVKELRPAQPDEISEVTGAPIGFSGPVGLKKVKIIIDGDVTVLSDFVTGANQKDKHYKNVNLNRDFKADQVADIRYAVEGDRCHKCDKELSLITTMEVGHVFKLGTRYSEPLGARYRAKDGKENLILMGCYGLGLNRIMAAIIEQYNDAKGIKWPASVAPYQVHLITVNQADESAAKVADELYKNFETEAISCLYDDRNERAGVKFNDADLIGLPIQVILSERNLSKGQIELKIRKSSESKLVEKQNLIRELRSLISSL